MKLALVFLIAACAMASPMYVRERRSASDANSNTTTSDANSNTTTVECAPATPCEWSVYEPKNKDIILLTILNSYCICGKGLECTFTDDDQSIRTYVYHCRPPQTTSKKK